MRVLVCGGGTAGHVNPALAIADIILQHEPDSVIEYVGTEKGIEGTLVRKKGMILHPIRVQGLKRSLSPANIRVLMMAYSARKECKKIIRGFAPDVVIGTGGYVCWPVISAAASLGIPTVLHESNAEPGFAVKTLRKCVDLILVNFEATKQHLKGANVCVKRVGMPVNPAFSDHGQTRRIGHISGLDSRDRQVKKILSFGGSLGATTINQAVLKLMKDYVKGNPKVRIEHATGTREYESVKTLFAEAGLDQLDNITLNEYIYDMPQKMREADLVICRSGASTLAELGVAKKAAILIPSPHVTGDQQNKNAAELLAKNAAIVLKDDDAVESIVDVVKQLFEEDESKLKELSNNIGQFALADCDERIYSEIKSLLEKQ